MLCAFVVILCAREVCGQAVTVYDFSSNAGVDRFAFGNSVPKSPIPPTANTIPSTEFFAADYTAVAVSDDSRHDTGGVGGCCRAAVRFAFTIAETPASITQLDLLWEGGGAGGASADIRVWLWNDVTASYEDISGRIITVAPPDTVVSVPFTISPSDYVDSANTVTLLVINKKKNNESGPLFLGILTDYVSLTVTATGCSADAQCDDGNGCTADACVGGVCQNTIQPADTVCRASMGPCDLEEVCDGLSAACPADALEPAGTVCTDDLNECTDDVCDGAGTCTHPNLAAGTLCGAGPTDCSAQDTCDGMGTCQANDLGAGSTCTDDLNDCTDDVCDGTGTCTHPDLADGTVCADDGNDCTDDVCATGVCTHSNLAAGTLCGAGPTDCSAQDTCDGLGTCQANDLATGTVCTDDLNDCTDDVCDGLGACTHPSLVAGTLCGAGPTDCSNQDTCDGLGTCQANDLGAGSVCTDDLNDCTDDVCDGLGACTHPSLTAGTLCGVGPTDCSAQDTCDGLGTCQANDLGAGSVCTDDLNECTDNVCDGVGTCTHPSLAAGTLCGAGPTDCSAQDTCDGLGTCQANDLGAGSVCTDDLNDCTDDVCDGLGACTHPSLAAGALCGAGPTDCSAQDTCDGLGTCQANDLGAGSVCTDDLNDCTDDVCDGLGTCTHPNLADGSACDDGNACTSDACSTGVCVGTDTTPAGQCCDPVTGLLTPIDDADACTTDTCNPDGTVTHADIGQITVNLELEAVSLLPGNTITRDVTFLITTCGESVDTRVVPVTVDELGIGTALLTGVDASAGFVAVSEGHTLRQLVPLSFVACAASADLTAGSQLPAGDFHTAFVPQDNLVDITDFSILASSFNDPIDPNLSTGADATGDGLQGMVDFMAIQVNFFTAGDGGDACVNLGVFSDNRVRDIGTPGHRDEGTKRRRMLPLRSFVPSSLRPFVPSALPLSRIAVDRLPILGAEKADLNADGVVDARDIRAFARLYNLPLLPEFDLTLNRLERVKAGRARR